MGSPSKVMTSVFGMCRDCIIRCSVSFVWFCLLWINSVVNGLNARFVVSAICGRAKQASETLGWWTGLYFSAGFFQFNVGSGLSETVERRFCLSRDFGLFGSGSKWCLEAVFIQFAVISFSVSSQISDPSTDSSSRTSSSVSSTSSRTPCSASSLAICAFISTRLDLCSTSVSVVQFPLFLARLLLQPTTLLS